MTDRLISENALIKDMEQRYFKGKVTLREPIDEQPTAFDVNSLKEDNIAHKFYEIFVKGKSIKWNEFPTESRCGCGYYDYYYAEDELYLVRDRIIGEIFLVKAKSPKEAIEKRDELIAYEAMKDMGELYIV